MNENEPHAHGKALCEDCNHKWIAVWPLGADDLQCPSCGGTNTDRDAEGENDFS